MLQVSEARQPITEGEDYDQLVFFAEQFERGLIARGIECCVVKRGDHWYYLSPPVLAGLFSAVHVDGADLDWDRMDTMEETGPDDDNDTVPYAREGGPTSQGEAPGPPG
jgi:hypothetical protein